MCEIVLLNFAPLIQLWAGICVLFFYEPLLKNSPLSKLQKEKSDLLNNFLGKYQAYLTNEQLDEGYKIADSKWEVFYQTVKNLAALNFYYAVFILAYIGIEAHSDYKFLYQALQLTNSCVILYTLLSWVFYQTSFFTKYLKATYFIVILLLVFHFNQPLNDFFLRYIGSIGTYRSKSFTSVFTLFTCISGMMVIIVQITYNSCQMGFAKRKLKQINKNADSLNELLIGNKGLNDMKGSLKKKTFEHLIADGYPETAVEYQMKLSDFVHREIQEEFDSLLPRRWKKQMKSALQKAKYFVMTAVKK